MPARDQLGHTAERRRNDFDDLLESGASPPTQPDDKTNLYAMAALVCGILPVGPLAIGFGIAGLRRAARVHRGRAMSILGLVLGLCWLPIDAVAAADVLRGGSAPAAIATPAAPAHPSAKPDPGCTAAVVAADAYGKSMARDTKSKDIDKQIADLQLFANNLNTAARKSHVALARAVMTRSARDTQSIVNTYEILKTPGAAAWKTFRADLSALHKACGT